MEQRQKIKIAQVITRLDWGGAPDIVRILCTRLDYDLYDVRLITGPTKFPTLKTRKFLQDFNDRTFVIPQLKRNISPFDDLLALIKLYIYLRRERFNIVHTHTAKAGFLGRLAAFMSGTSVIVHTPHGHNFYGYFTAFLTKVIIAIEKVIGYFTDKIIALTELEKQDFIKYGVASPDKIRVIYQGLELEEYTDNSKNRQALRQSFQIAQEQVLIGLVARLEHIKGPFYFIEAARKVAQNFALTKFIVIGEGSLRKSMEDRVTELGLEDRFIFTGWRQDSARILPMLDLLVLPSLNEAVGMVLIEAQCAGVAVIASAVGGVPEIIEDGVSGILVKPGSTEDLAKAINFLVENKDKREALALEGQKRMKNKFKAEEMIQNTSSLYLELIGQKEKAKNNK